MEHRLLSQVRSARIVTRRGAYLIAFSEVAPVPLISARIKSLRTVANTDWVFLIEPLIVFDATLRQDPAGVYASMEFESRELYRKRVAFVARHSNILNRRLLKGLSISPGNVSSIPQMIRVSSAAVSMWGITWSIAALLNLPLAPSSTRASSTAFACRFAPTPDDFYITAIEFITVIFIAAVIFPSPAE